MKDKIILIFLIIFFLVSLGAVSATDAVDDVLGDDASDIYVSVGGNDSNAGTSSSPYATVGKAIEVSGNSSIIHLGEGTFTGENNSALTVDKQNMANNGTITIIGAGIDKTIIDLNGAQFLNVNSGTSMALVNLTIINGFASNGGAVYSQGNVSIDSVKFVNNSASTRGGALYLSNYLTILNSIFENNYLTGTSFTSQGGSVYARGVDIYNLIDNNKFKNSYGVRGGGLYANYANITNNEFENCTVIGSSGMGGAIYGQNVNFKDNTIFDCSAESGNGNKIYVSGSYFNGKLTIFENSTVDIISTTFTIDATLTDDMGNEIHGPSVTFYFNDTVIGSASSQNGIVTGTFTKLLDNGVYVVNAGSTLLDVKNATAIYKIDRTFNEIYVSPTLGNDTSGNGSKENPYATIKKAISEGFNQGNFVNVHLLEGTYTGSENTLISLTNLGYLNIIGENDKVIIDGNNTASQAFSFGQNLIVELDNITFTRFYSRWGNLISLSSNYQSPTKIIFDTVTFDNNELGSLFNIYFGELYNCKIINNRISSYIGSAIDIIDNLTFENNTGSNLRISMCTNTGITGIISNSVFKDNTITGTNGYGILIPSFNATSRSNTFENNIGKAITVERNTNLVSINDTFKNLTDKNGGVIDQQGNAEFINAKFIDNTATAYGGAIYHRGGELKLTDCTFENNKAPQDGDIYGIATTQTPYTLLNMENTLTFVSLNTNNSKFQLKANFKLDNLIIGGYNVNFYLNDTLIGSAPLVNNTATVNVAGVSDGVYTITGTIDSVNKTTVIDGILNLNANPVAVWDTYVSENGNDTTGDGSKEKPFATIKHAFDNAMVQNALSIVIHTIGTLKGEGNVLLDLQPDINLTIVGEDKETSILDVEENTQGIYFKPTSDNVYVELKNMTILNGIGSVMTSTSSYSSTYGGFIRSYSKNILVDNCIFENASGFALSVHNKINTLAPYGSIIINNTEFKNCEGSFLSLQTAYNITILNTNFTDCDIGRNVANIIIMDAYSPHSSTQILDVTKLIIDNCNFDGNYKTTPQTSYYSNTIMYIPLVDVTITNTNFTNNGNISTLYLYSVVNSQPDIKYRYAVYNIENCYFSNNTQDIVSTIQSSSTDRSVVNIVNTTFNESGGFAFSRFSTVLWNINNASFININNLLSLSGEKSANQDTNQTFGLIENTLFVNCNLRLDGMNITDSAFYNTSVDINRARYAYYTPEVYLNNNYWNSTLPNYTLSYSSGNIYCDAWIVPELTTDNESGPVQTITLSYKLFDGENYIDYDVSNVPIFDEHVTMNVTDGTIDPTEALLTKEGLNFTYKYEGLGNQTITAELDNNITLELNVTFYKAETQLNLTLDANEVHVGDNLTVNIVLADKDGNLINGSADIYLNSALIDTIDLVNGEGVLSIVMDKTPMVYEIFANYTGDKKYESSTNASMFNVLKTEINVDVLNNNSKDNVTFDISFNYPANGTVEVTIANDTYTAPVEDGKAQLVLDPMDVGKYEALVSYNGIVNQTVPFNITRDTKTSIKAEDVEMYYGNIGEVNVTLTDAYGEALVNESVILSVNGTNYTKTTDDKGIAVFEISDLAVGNYTADIYYLGNTEQDSATANVNIAVLYNTTSIIDASDVEMYYGDVGELNVTLTNAYGDALVNESVTLSVNGTNYTETTDDEGIASFEITDLELGNYTAEIYYLGSDEQDPASTKANITVLFNTATNIKAEDVVLYYGIPGEFNVTLTNAYGEALANESVILSVNGTNYTKTTDDKGIAVFEIADLELGNYTAEVYYLGSAEKDPANTTAVITVLPDTTTIISVDDLVMYYKDGSRLYINLSDVRGNPLVNKSVIINLNGANYTRATNENGTASIAINLNSGNYTVGLYYNGTEAHDAANATALITILPTVNGTDVVKVFRNGTQYYATFLDNKGNYLAEGTNVTFNINGVTYTRQINGSEGRARLNINLAQGDYIITAMNPVTGEMAANNITVIPRIINNNDLVKYYRNDSQYYVQLIGDDGKPVGANETVTFNINGVMYERKTNESGIARLNINLQTGEYVITAMYKDCNVANNITVLPVLKAENVTMVYKDGTQFKASLVDGQGNPLANTNVTFNINGVFYERLTDSNGVAALNINLMPGEYIITSSYNGTNIANTIKINEQ